MAVVRPALDTRRAATCQHVGELVAILAPDCNVAVLERSPDEDIRRYVEAAFADELTSKHIVGSSDSLASVFPTIGEAHEAGRTKAVADAEWLRDLFAELLGASRIGIRLAAVRRAMCPRFHVDRVGVRMLTTYTGPSTEYLDECDVVRPNLARLEDAAAPRATIRRAAPFDVVLLKGEAWPGNEHHGIVHRSPAVPSSCSIRVVVTYDALHE